MADGVPRDRERLRYVDPRAGEPRALLRDSCSSKT